jgi:hypothetical protein
MNNKLMLLCALAAVAVVTAVSLPIALIPDHPKNVNYPQVTFSWSAREANVTQGSTVYVNCTVFNTDYNSSVNEGFTTYAYAFNGSEPPWDIKGQPRVYNVTFTPRVLDGLGPRETGTTTLCINFAGDAPVGNYSFWLQGFGNSLQVTVIPKMSG